MPTRIFCGGCGLVFYEGPDVKPGHGFVRTNGRYCPKCGKVLEFNTDAVKFTPAKGERDGESAKRSSLVTSKA